MAWKTTECILLYVEECQNALLLVKFLFCLLKFDLSFQFWLYVMSVWLQLSATQMGCLYILEANGFMQGNLIIITSLNKLCFRDLYWKSFMSQLISMLTHFDDFADSFFHAAFLYYHFKSGLFGCFEFLLVLMTHINVCWVYLVIGH